MHLVQFISVYFMYSKFAPSVFIADSLLMFNEVRRNNSLVSDQLVAHVSGCISIKVPPMMDRLPWWWVDPVILIGIRMTINFSDHSVSAALCWDELYIGLFNFSQEFHISSLPPILPNVCLISPILSDVCLISPSLPNVCLISRRIARPF